MKYLVLDLETETHARFKRKANPFLEENYIVARGWKVRGDARCSSEFYDSADDVPELHIPDDVQWLVAHNVKFELLYEKRFSPNTLHAFFKRGGKVWCTQYAEYLLNGQHRKYHMNALDKVAPIYGGKTKIDGVKALWEAGVKTSEIDRGLLNDYLIGTEEEGRNGGDIGNTELIFLGQVNAAKASEMVPAILARMDGLCSTADMEYRGLKIDVDRARNDLKERLREKAVADAKLADYVKNLPEGLEFNWGSPVHKSAIIFGGTVKYQKLAPYLDDKTGELARSIATERWPLQDGVAVKPEECTKQDVYLSGKKKGEPKFKNVRVPGPIKKKYQDFFHEFPGYTKPEKSWVSSLVDGKANKVYSTGSEVIDALSVRGIEFLDDLVENNRLAKEIGTYYLTKDSKGNQKGMLTCVQPWDHMLHHKLNHTSTVTSRLSSSDPNLQNLTRADFNATTGKYKSTVKGMFVSRFGDEGKMIEIDYSQLEVVVQALLSNDKNLIRDLNNKVDFHCKRVALKNNVSYDFALDACKNEEHPEHAKWKVERTGCKIFSFQRAYGAGAELIAASTGMPIDEVKELMEAEDREYSGVAKFNADVEAEINATARPFRDPERGYRTFRAGSYKAITGAEYSFRSYDAPAYLKKRGVLDAFSPTERKNYPVQGTGGELVQMVLGALWRWLVSRDFFDGRAYLVNTVHDCVWFDVHQDVLDEVAARAAEIMQSIPALLKERFNIECPVNFPVDVEVGNDMLDMSHWAPGH